MPQHWDLSNPVTCHSSNRVVGHQMPEAPRPRHRGVRGSISSRCAVEVCGFQGIPVEFRKH
eukprot:13150412-Alexandrium_andersonii.AAC.1